LQRRFRPARAADAGQCAAALSLGGGNSPVGRIANTTYSDLQPGVGTG
jgi:hypothetical protein